MRNRDGKIDWFDVWFNFMGALISLITLLTFIGVFWLSYKIITDPDFRIVPTTNVIIHHVN
jgi:hypothetical protein